MCGWNENDMRCSVTVEWNEAFGRWPIIPENKHFLIEEREMLFTLLTFLLGCTLDLEQCGGGRLLAGPFANEAIKSLLPRLSKGQREQGKSSAVSANTKHLSRAAVRIHNKPPALLSWPPSRCGPPLSVRPLARPGITGSIRTHLSMCTESRQMEMEEKHWIKMMSVLLL